MELVAQLRQVAHSGCRRLVLLGDIFHVWVGFEAFETPEVAEVTAALEEVRQQGLRVDYIEGNRDFFLDKGPYGRFFDAVTLETSFEAGGRRYLVVHGDGLNDRDRKYRFWRWLSKSTLSRLLVRRIPSVLARRIVHSTDERLSRTNFKHKAQIPEAVIRDYAEQRLKEGYDALLLGHFHEARRWAVKGGEVILLEAWFKTRRVEWFGHQGEPEGDPWKADRGDPGQ